MCTIKKNVDTEEKTPRILSTYIYTHLHIHTRIIIYLKCKQRKAKENITAGFSTFNIIEWQKHKIEIYKRKAKKKKDKNDGKKYRV